MPRPATTMLSLALGTACLLTLFTGQTQGCSFANTALDTQNKFTWYQPLSLDNRLRYSFSLDNDVMTAETEINLPNYFKRTYTCLKDYGPDTVMVQVKEVDRDGQPTKKDYFQCLRFEQLTDNVVRQFKTKLRALRKKVDCTKENYEADQAVLVALDFLEPQTCPLQGGFQLRHHPGENTSPSCLDSTKTYNPNIRFQCDMYNVIVDFGRECEPMILRDSQIMRRRHLAHLSCVGSWKDSHDIDAILFRMRDSPYTLWCLHYVKVNGSVEVLNGFMTLDGRCVPNAFHDESVPRKTSLFGHMVKYVPLDDLRCSDHDYVGKCKDRLDTCDNSNKCPSACHRCNVRPSKSDCQFMDGALGHWQAVNSTQQMSVDISQNTISVSHYGDFSCRGLADSRLSGHVFPVVQSSDESSCLPYYACAEVFSPFPGVLNFHLRPVWRNLDSGEPFSCSQTNDKIGYVIPVKDEQTITMVNMDKLAISPCRFEEDTKFPAMLEPCMLEVLECNGDCTDLEVQYDNETCGNLMAFPIDDKHVCYGNFQFDDQTKGMLTKSEFSAKFYCWIYTRDRLYIASPEHCNPERVGRIVKDGQASITYDPVNRLTRPVHSSSGMGEDNSGGSTEKAHTGKAKDNDNNGDKTLCPHCLFLFVTLVFPLLQHVL